MAPSSAATVSGVVCETKFAVGRTSRSSSASRRLADAWPPIPTPFSGSSRTTRTVSSTRWVRSLVSRRSESPRISIDAT